MALNNVVLPDWLDLVPGVDFAPEKEILADFEGWALREGWNVSKGEKLPVELQRRTDVLLEQPSKGWGLRIAILPKPKKTKQGAIRIDASTLRTLELTYQSRW